MEMKQKYVTPTAEIVAVCVNTTLTSSRIPVGGETDSFNAKEQTNDWDNIWK